MVIIMIIIKGGDLMAKYTNAQGKSIIDYGAGATRLIEAGYLPADEDAIKKAREQGYTGQTAKQAVESKLINEPWQMYQKSVPEYQSFLTEGAYGEPALPDWAKMSPYSEAYAQDIASRVGDIQSQTDPYLQQSGSAINDLASMARSTEMSPYAQKLLEMQNTAESASRGNLTNEASGAYAGALSNLGMRGGLESGARERLATNFGRQTMAGQQDIGMQYDQARAGIAANDLQNKQNLLEKLPGLYGTQAGLTSQTGLSLLSPYAQAQQYGIQGKQIDLDTTLKERAAKQAAAENRGNAYLGIVGANKTAMAQPDYNPWKATSGAY